MKWKEARAWFIEFLEENHKIPVPVETKYLKSDDIRQHIQNGIHELDTIMDECKNGDKKRISISHNRLRNMLEIKQIIESKSE